MMETDKDFTFIADVGLLDPQICILSQRTARKSELHFDSGTRSFTATHGTKILVSLLPAQLCKLRTERCPNGRNYIIRYKRSPDEDAKELSLKCIPEVDKTRLHATLLQIVGVETQIATRKMARLSPSTSSLTLPVENKENIGKNNSSRKKEHAKEKEQVVPRPSERRAASSLLTSRRPEIFVPDKELPLPELFIRPTNFRTELRGDKRLRSGKNGEWVKEQDERLDGQMVRFSPSTSSSALPGENKENIEEDNCSFSVDILENTSSNYPEILVPEKELPLPERFIRPNFWTELRGDKGLRSGKNGEWVKGQDERLTIDGLLCLCDGEWLNADIIDSYLGFLCQRSDRAQFIPTYAILSYERKGKVPSEWYWPLEDADIILAPAHLYNNHWAMAVLNMAGRQLTLMDSMNHDYTSSEKIKFMDTIMNILRDVAMLQSVDIGDRDTWEVHERLAVPQQRNGNDCGIFALLYAEYSLETREFDFEQQHMPYFRRRICHSIISAILDDQRSPAKGNNDGNKTVQCQIVL